MNKTKLIFITLLMFILLVSSVSATQVEDMFNSLEKQTNNSVGSYQLYEITENYMEFGLSATSTSTSTVYINSKESINFNLYDNLTYELNYTRDGGGSYKLGYSTFKGATELEWNYAEGDNSAHNKINRTIDISGISGEYYLIGKAGSTSGVKSIIHLYNIYLDGELFPFIDNNATITTLNTDYNITLISNETQTYDNVNLTQEINILNNDTRLWNITLEANEESDQEINYTDYNFSLNGSISTTFDLLKFNINFNAIELVSGATITNFNITMENGSIWNNSQTASINYGLHNFTFSKNNYYNLTLINQSITSNTIINFTDVYNAILNLTATDIATSTTINNFNGWVYQSDYSYNVSFNTTTALAQINLKKDLNYTVYLYGQENYTSDTDTVYINLTNQLLNFDLFVYNSVRFNIYNEDNSSLMDQLVSLTIISNVSSFYNSTSNGLLTIGFLTPLSYEVRFTSNNFNDRSIFLTVSTDSTQNISVYMTPNTTTELQIIEVLDTGNSPVENAAVWLQKEQLNSSVQWITVAEVSTNYDGKTAVYIERSLTDYYRLAVIYEGVARAIQPSGDTFTGKTLFIPGITETIQLIVTIDVDVDESIDDLNAISTDMYFGGSGNDTVYFSFVDGRNSIVGGRLVCKGKYADDPLEYEALSNELVTGSSGLISYTFPITNNTIYECSGYIVYTNEDILYEQDVKDYGLDVLVDKNTGLLFAVAIFMVVVLLTISYGALLSGIFAFATIGILNYFRLINIPWTIVTTFLALIVIFFFRPKKPGDL